MAKLICYIFFLIKVFGIIIFFSQFNISHTFLTTFSFLYIQKYSDIASVFYVTSYLLIIE